MSVAVTERVWLQRIHEMQGLPPAGFPNWEEFAKSIPFFEGINLEELIEDDPKPFFITLDILYVEAESRNGLVYDEELVGSIIRQLPGKGAKFGHSEFFGNGTPKDDADWVGLKRIGNIVYAKLYVPEGDARTQLARMKRRKGKIRTSFEGYGARVPILDAEGNDTGTFRLKDFELGAIDLVRDVDAALADYQSGEPIFTSETDQKKTKENPMSITTIAEIPQTLRDQLRQQWMQEAQVQENASRITTLEASLESANAERETSQARVAELEAQTQQQQARISELEQQAAQTQAQLTEAQTRLAQYEQSAFEQMLSSTVGSFTANWNVRGDDNKKRLEAMNKQFLRAVKEGIGSERDETKVKETAQSVWDAEFKLIAEGLRDSMSGGSAHIGGSSNSAPKTYSEEEVTAARAQMGI